MDNSNTNSQKTVKRLGRGLSALLGESNIQNYINSENFEASYKSASNVISILPLKYLKSGKYQPRKTFIENELKELAESIKENGILQPIIVRKLPSENGNTTYEIIAGERRYRASKIAGMDTIPAIIKDITDAEALQFAIIENIQRENLSPIEEAVAYKKLMEEFGYTQEQLSFVVGKSRSHVANTLRLLKLPDEIREMVDNGKITAGHARAIVNSEDKLDIVQEVIEMSLNVRDTEELIKNRKSGDKKTIMYESYLQEYGEKLERILGFKVKISYNNSKNCGKVSINYEGFQELEKLISLIES